MSQAMKRGLFGLSALALISALVAATLLLSAGGESRADDATHTTSLTQGTWDFGSGSVAAVIAVITSTDSGDNEWEIRLFHTPQGGQESPSGGSSKFNVSGQTGTDVAIATSGMSSGDSIRAQFRAFDSSGNVVFLHDRTLTLP